MRRILLAGIIFAAPFLAANATPPLTIERAAALAQKELRDRGLDKQIFVASLAIEKESLADARDHWFARWSEAIPGDDRKKEVGLRINMDGGLVRVVQGTGGADELLRDHRTRIDRPSILNLKH